jgi:hypothetical protein
MEDWHFWVPTGISLTAAAFSVASWWHNLSSHSERRFGEIATLRTDFLRRLTRLEERLEDLRTALLHAQFGLRDLSDSNEKYEAIESSEEHRNAHQDYAMRAFNLRRDIEGRPAGENSSDLLRSLQLSEHELVSLEHGADRLTAVAESWVELFNKDRQRKGRRAVTDEGNLLDLPET